jgi:hypothetical protein
VISELLVIGDVRLVIESKAVPSIVTHTSPIINDSLITDHHSGMSV